MVFYAASNNISVISLRQFTIFTCFLGFTNTRLGLCSEVSCPRTRPRRTQSVECGSNPGPLDYKSNTLLLNHAQDTKIWKKKQQMTSRGGVRYWWLPCCLFGVLRRINSVSVIERQQFTNPCFFLLFFCKPYLTSPLSWDWRASRSASGSTIQIILSAMGEIHN